MTQLKSFKGDSYEIIMADLERAKEHRLPVKLKYGEQELIGAVNGLDAQEDTFELIMPGEFHYEALEIRKVRQVEKFYREIPALREGKPVKIWLDDVRPAPAGYEHVKSVLGAEAMIEQVEAEGGTIEVLDLDHDLGDFAPYGGDAIKLLYYLIEQEKFYRVKLHTANPVGRANMQAMIDRYWP